MRSIFITGWVMQLRVSMLNPMHQQRDAIRVITKKRGCGWIRVPGVNRHGSDGRMVIMLLCLPDQLPVIEMSPGGRMQVGIIEHETRPVGGRIVIDGCCDLPQKIEQREISREGAANQLEDERRLGIPRRKRTREDYLISPGIASGHPNRLLVGGGDDFVALGNRYGAHRSGTFPGNGPAMQPGLTGGAASESRLLGAKALSCVRVIHNIRGKRRLG